MNLSKQTTEAGVRYTLEFSNEELETPGMDGALLLKIAKYSQSPLVSVRLVGLAILAEALEQS